mmetsp:Transcript_10223/g.18674  ORF Transcript_10223/g.18674 Transcript_10223/m.18674 type:complete len:84 (-) Transcript_10223:36-287(-)
MPGYTERKMGRGQCCRSVRDGKYNDPPSHFLVGSSFTSYLASYLASYHHSSFGLTASNHRTAVSQHHHSSLPPVGTRITLTIM